MSLAFVAACQPLQRPFQPEVKSSWRAAPGPRASLYVEAVKNGPPDLNTAIAAKLQNLGIPAFTGDAIPDRYYVQGEIIEKPDGRYLSWTIYDPQNRDTGLYTAEKLPDAVEPLDMSAKSIDVIALKSASNIDRLLGGDGVNFATLDKPVIFVPIVKGAPGDGAESLAAAIQEELVKLGLDVLPTEKGANFIVRGKADLSPPKFETQIIQLTWSLERRNGEQVGKVQQRNRIKAGSLNGAWGATAFMAAKGGADGVYNLLKKSEPKYFKSKS
ncbi:MAG: hypothetical protein K9G33_08845 [Sneathiella sp.]|nr:hypothetical protein [Sneathiella sp.]